MVEVMHRNWGGNKNKNKKKKKKKRRKNHFYAPTPHSQHFIGLTFTLSSQHACVLSSVEELHNIT